MNLSNLLATAGRTAVGAALGLGLAWSVLAPQVAQAEPAMWVVKDKDSTIYLFGTVHLLKKDAAWNTPKVQAAMAQSKELWLELIDAEDTAKLAPVIQQLGVDAKRPLSSKLSAAQNAKLAKVAAEYGLQPAQLEPLKPWLAAVTLSLLPLQKAGWDPNAGVDKLLRAQAVKEGDALKAFETAEQQMRFFADLPEPLQISYLEQVLDDTAQGTALMDRLAAAYLAGDPDTIGRIMTVEMKTEAPELYAALLTRRNVAWAAQIQKMLAGKGTHFVAVGAGHLAGPDSVQVQLAKRGIKARRR
jgi:uncharacterized protein YbaP (TraB family)